MIRFAIVLLLLANAGYYAFSHGMLRSMGWAPENPAEPERMQQQVNPEALRIMTREEMEQAQKQVQGAAPAAEPSANGAPEAAGKPAAEPDKTAEKPADKTADKLAEKLAEKPEKPEKK